jgi:hypothetical protein
MATAIRFSDLGGIDYAYCIEFRYDPVAVAIVKSVPAHARRYDPENRTWYVDRGYATQLADDFSEAGFVVLGIRPRAAICESDWARAVLRRVGTQRHDAVFRALSKVLHPDAAAGDTVLMRELLDARDEIGGDR